MANLAKALIKKILLGIGIAAIMLPSLALAARTSIDWVNLSGTTYIQPNYPNGMDLLIFSSNHYINFNTVTGTNGYGIRDNGGIMEFKNSGGAWAGMGSGGGGGGGGAGGWTFIAGGIYNSTTTDQVMIDETATTTNAKLEVNGLSAFKGGASTTLLSVSGQSWHTGLATFGAASTTDLTASNSLFVNFAGGLVYAGASKQLLSTATSTLSASSPLTGSFVVPGSGGSIGCQNASASQGGCIQSQDYQRLYTATTTAVFPITYTQSTNSFTSAFSTTTNTGLTANSFVYTGPSGILLTVASSGLALPNTALANSTISGVALGGTLNSLSNDAATLSGTSYNGSATVSNWAINLNNANTWTGLQKFSGAGTTTVANGLIASVVATQYVIASSTRASQLPYASSTNITATTFCFPTDCRTVWPTGSSGDPFDHTYSPTYSATGSPQMVGTTTPAAAQVTIGTSTASQLTLSDNNPANIQFAFRAIANSFFISTSTAAGTSTNAMGNQTLMGFDPFGNVFFGASSTAQVESSIRAFVSFVSNTGNDAYVTFKNLAPGKAMIFRVRAASSFVHLDLASTVGLWLVGNFGSSAFGIWDDSGSGVPVVQIAQSTKSGSILVDAASHVFFGGVTGVEPVISACGTSPLVAGNDSEGTITVGSGSVNTCTLTFVTTYTNIPRCILNLNITTATTTTLYSNTTATTLTLRSTTTSAGLLNNGAGSNLGGSKVDYWCTASSTASLI